VRLAHWEGWGGEEEMTGCLRNNEMNIVQIYAVLAGARREANCTTTITAGYSFLATSRRLSISENPYTVPLRI